MRVRWNPTPMNCAPVRNAARNRPHRAAPPRAPAALAAAVPAQAQQPENAQVAFVDVCDSTVVLFTSDAALDWVITVAGTPFWPQEGDQQPAPGEVGIVQVRGDAGLIRVDYQGSTSEWPKDHTWTPHPEGSECDENPDELTVSQPTCDVATGEITIPTFGMWWLLDGDPVEPGSTQQVEPGTHIVEGLGRYLFEHFLEERQGEFFRPARTYVVDIEAPDCPEGEDGAGDGGDGSGEGGDGPGGGASGGGDATSGTLPATGSPAGPLAGAAALLLLVGGVLHVLSRRRSVSAG